LAADLRADLCFAACVVVVWAALMLMLGRTTKAAIAHTTALPILRNSDRAKFRISLLTTVGLNGLVFGVKLTGIGGCCQR
jgi:hypothetical protein